MKPFLTLRGWHEDKCVYWNVSVALKCVWTSSILFDAKRGPLKTSVSQKTARLDKCEFDCGMESVSETNEIADFLFA